MQERVQVTSRRRIQSVDRALDILELVANAPHGVALCDIADGLGLRRQTAYNIIMTLVERRYLEKNDHRPTYSLAAVMGALRSRQARWNRRVFTPAIPVVEKLCRDADATAWLGQHSHMGILARIVVDRRDWLSPRYYYGLVMAMHGASVLYQTYMTPDQLAEYRARFPLRDRGDPFWGTEEMLDEFLTLVRREGRLVFYKGGIFRAGAPVFNADGSIAAMVGITREMGLPLSPEPERLVDLVCHAAAEISIRAARP